MAADLVINTGRLNHCTLLTVIVIGVKRFQRDVFVDATVPRLMTEIWS